MAIPAVAVGGALILVAGAVAHVATADVAAVRAQRVADLAAVSAVRATLRLPAPSLSDPPAARRALTAALAPVVDPDGARVERVDFPGAGRGTVGSSVQVTVSVAAPMGLRATATARAALRVSAGPGGATGWATGGGYSGPLVYRDGKPTCPAVAASFDLMNAATRASGVDLAVVSGFRSDAEQAVLFARDPDPRWVAPPGRSRHREATELDIGPPSAYGWLAANATRFGFVQRYSWEPWHYGHLAGCGPVVATDASAAVASAPSRTDETDAESRLWGDAAGAGPAVDASAASPLAPSWVPARYAPGVARAAVGNGLPPALLAALIQAESGYDPHAVSPVGARGIAQFMPGTAASVGLTDPFDPDASIAAAGRLLGAHLREFGSVPLALAAYNAGPGAVHRYGGVPPYPETQAYVARIIALAAGGGATPASGAWSGSVVLVPVTPGGGAP